MSLQSAESSDDEGKADVLVTKGEVTESVKVITRTEEGELVTEVQEESEKVITTEKTEQEDTQPQEAQFVEPEQEQEVGLYNINSVDAK